MKRAGTQVPSVIFRVRLGPVPQPYYMASEEKVHRRRWADVVVGRPPTIKGDKEDEGEKISEGSRQEHPDEDGDEDEDISDTSPKFGRRRRRRPRRRNGGSGSGASGVTFGDSIGKHGEVLRKSKNVVTWSDLCADNVIETLLPGSGSPQTQLPIQSEAAAGRLSVDFSARVDWAAVQPQCFFTPIQTSQQHQGFVLVGATPINYGVVNCIAEDVPASDTADGTEWTDKNADEMRRWLCKTFSSGVPGAVDASPAEFAEMLRKFSQQAYED